MNPSATLVAVTDPVPATAKTDPAATTPADVARPPAEMTAGAVPAPLMLRAVILVAIE